MKNYSFTKTAIVRTPIEEKQMDLTWEKIQAIFSKKENREALFIGSPNIYKALVMWETGEAFQTEEELKNLKGSLYKYASRLANRSTPFGMFATVAAVDLNSETNLNIAASTFGRFTKFDMYFLGSFLPVIVKNDAIRNALKYYSNNSIYTVLDKYRYVEYYFKDNVRFHKISEVEMSDYLELIFEKAKNGVLLSELADLLVSDEISLKDAQEFIDTLIQSQFIVTELEFTITGEDYFEKLLRIFSEARFDFYEAEVIKELITNLKSKINYLDTNNSNDPALYTQIHELVNEELNNVDISKLFQVDSFRKIYQGSVSFKTLKNLRPALSVLNKLQSVSENNNLKEFKRKFLERYEEYEQPLVSVLDPDIGIGYAKTAGAKSALVDELLIGGGHSDANQISMDSKKTFLFKKLLQATKNNLQSIELTDEEINKFEENESLYPDTFSAFVNIFHENGVEKINLKTASGPSANGLIGRFSHLDTKILDLCNEVSSIENQLNPDKIIAEIVHLPQARTGNILYRNFQRDYEIPYLGNASVDRDHQIMIDDLYVSVKSGKIVLRSKRLNKEIIPRLSNAHNFVSNALPIYHFLCDLQNQNSFGFGFSWGALQNEFDFLPRLTYKDTIFSRATWNITKTEIDHILAAGESKNTEFINNFRKNRNIPDLVYISQGDNEVLINFNNELSCNVFYYMLKSENFVQLKEFLFEENTITGNYCNEIIFTAHKNIEKKAEIIEANQFVSNENQQGVATSFSIGEEWLYYKFYCGERAGEELLKRGIAPIVEELKEKGIIDKWFFIRYYDAQGHHIRFRVLLKNSNLFTDCIRIIRQYTDPLEQTRIIWKTQTDNYLRELQRYGYEAIEKTETLFFNDSDCTLKFADMIEGDTGEKIRWMFCLLSIDHFLNDFDVKLEGKVKLFNVAKTGFGKEFNRSGRLNKQINEMFVKHESEIEYFLDPNLMDEIYEPLLEILHERTEKNADAVKQIKELGKEHRLPTYLDNIMLSYVHMICNRIFLTKHRIHEMVVYDFLYKYYSKQLHTGKREKTTVTEELIS
ncbi:lantibiotic dehydratase [Flavobacterium sp. 1355]|uniref:lantibiotic dehydratase n=1 Tax=Flavobacterium sp. 1355 TaxID=2806571 RepID=UPI001AEAF9BE|nr:lantibiotic dehydratase [Flavobacterium sp. 1355]MBP1225375.1 thiopeptide-type bacteriocin biosynthesis protein [Flavobacterium sp. 1355]